MDTDDMKTFEKLLDKLSHLKVALSSELRIEAKSIRLCKCLYGKKNQLESFRRSKRKENPYFRTIIPRKEINPLALNVAVNIGNEKVVEPWTWKLISMLFLLGISI